MKTRLQKFLAEYGGVSRRQAERLIAEGKCEVNGQLITEMGHMIDPELDTVKFMGKAVGAQKRMVYIMLNKPRGYVTTAKDQFGRPTVLDLVRTDTRLYPVGRLDYDTSGLLILTNDGKLTQALTHPGHMIEKVYLARVKGIPTADELKRLRAGVDIGGYITAPAKADIARADGAYSVLRLTIIEGKNRQVRLMCEAIGRSAVSLKRVAIGRLSLGGLKTGDYRPLTAEEIDYFKGL